MVKEIAFEEDRDAMILTDSPSGLIWKNGRKTKDQTLAAPNKWRSDTAPLRQKSKLITIMRNNAGENSAHQLRSSFSPRTAAEIDSSKPGATTGH